MTPTAIGTPVDAPSPALELARKAAVGALVSAQSSAALLGLITAGTGIVGLAAVALEHFERSRDLGDSLAYALVCATTLALGVQLAWFSGRALHQRWSRGANLKEAP